MRQLPNLLTGLRLALAPVVGFLIYRQAFTAAVATIVVSGLSDYFDGYLARRNGWNSEIGRVLDPAADKLLMLLSYIGLTGIGACPGWLLGMILGRDAMIVLGASLLFLLRGVRVFPPRWPGKVSTTIQIMGAGLILLTVAVADWRGEARREWLLWVWWLPVAAVTWWSGADYFWTGVKMWSRSAKESGASGDG